MAPVDNEAAYSNGSNPNTKAYLIYERLLPIGRRHAGIITILAQVAETKAKSTCSRCENRA